MMTPGTVPPAREMATRTEEQIARMELLKKVQVMRDKIANRNDSEVTGDPNMSYAWVFDDPREISRYEGMGYTVVNATTGKAAKTRWQTSGGTHKRGDSILMQISKDLREAWEYDSAARAVEQISGAKEQFTQFAAEERIPVVKQ